MNSEVTLENLSKKLISYDVREKEEALNLFLKNFCPDFSYDSSKLKFVDKKNASKIMNNPKEYARWMLNFALDFLFLSQGTIKDTIENNSDNYTELSYYVRSEKYEDSYVNILTSKNGIAVEINGEVLSMARNRTKKDTWNANFSEKLATSIPLVRKKTKHGYAKIYY